MNHRPRKIKRKKQSSCSSPLLHANVERDLFVKKQGKRRNRSGATLFQASLKSRIDLLVGGKGVNREKGSSSSFPSSLSFLNGNNAMTTHCTCFSIDRQMSPTHPMLYYAHGTLQGGGLCQFCTTNKSSTRGHTLLINKRHSPVLESIPGTDWLTVKNQLHPWKFKKEENEKWRWR